MLPWKARNFSLSFSSHMLHHELSTSRSHPWLFLESYPLILGRGLWIRKVHLKVLEKHCLVDRHILVPQKRAL
jgi:hypothetical protein